MSARKAYISSLGTTGLLVAAALAMLVVVGALVAFDRWPNQAVAEAEAVQIADNGPHAIRDASKPRALAANGNNGRASRLSASRSAAILRRAAARAGRLEQSSRAATRTAPPARVGDPIVSDLPAPDTATGAPAPAPAAPAPAAATPSAPNPTDTQPPAIQLPPPGSITPTAGDGLTDLTTDVGGTVGTLSPQLGQTVSGTGSATTETLNAVLGGGQS